jgi:hypothetical protein
MMFCFNFLSTILTCKCFLRAVIPQLPTCFYGRQQADLGARPVWRDADGVPGSSVCFINF